MWEQYRDDAFADREIEPRPANVTVATVPGEIYCMISLSRLSFLLFMFRSLC